jgi:anti-sigma B factor antagonist
MPEIRYPIKMVRGVPVVTAPEEIDGTNAGRLRAALLRSAGRGHATLVADLSATEFCDTTGLYVLVRAHKRAEAEGGELRLVIPQAAAVLRVFTVTGVDGVIPICASLEEALTPTPAVAIQPGRPNLRLSVPG